jgi:hypothetical protein
VLWKYTHNGQLLVLTIISTVIITIIILFFVFVISPLIEITREPGQNIHSSRKNITLSCWRSAGLHQLGLGIASICVFLALSRTGFFALPVGTKITNAIILT